MTTTDKDLALVRRVAELMEIDLCVDPRCIHSSVTPTHTQLGGHTYWPLTDDAQCFKVMIRMSKTGTVCVGERGVSWHTSSVPVTPVPFENDTDEARRHAILECFVKGRES